MKIIRNSTSIEYKKIQFGEVFEWNNTLFIKTNMPKDTETSEYYCISLYDGVCCSFGQNDLVIPKEAEVHIKE